MKTSEFIKRVEALGYSINEYEYCYKVKVDEMNGFKDYEFAYVSKKQSHHMEVCPVSSNGDMELFDLMVEYTRTPIEDRKEENKYYIRPKGMNIGNVVWNYDKDEKNWIIDDINESVWYKTQFTRSEIKELTGQELEHYSYCEVGTDTWVN